MALTPDTPSVREIDFDSIKLLEIVGEGSFGVVYKGRWQDKPVAVKLITNPDKESFAVEVRQLSRVEHENIVYLHGACTTGPKICLVMEFAEGGSLFNVLHSSPNVHYKIDHALSWMYQCARGVEYLHGMTPRPLIHRDLKPPNLLLIEGGTRLKICDFGTAADKCTYMTNNRGSAAWMAPEVFTSDKYTEKCDVFSWGIILWEVLSRRRPFYIPGRTAFSILWQVYQGKRPPLIRNCPAILEAIMTRCWDKDPTLRPDMSQLATVMGRLCALCPCGQEPVKYLPDSKWQDLMEASDDGTQNVGIPEVDEDQDDDAGEIVESFPASMTTNSTRSVTLPQPNNAMISMPLMVDVDPNAWGELNNGSMELRTMPGFDRMVPRLESTTVGNQKAEDHTVTTTTTATAADPDLDSLYMFLDPNLQPAEPDPDDPRSMELFNEHKKLAQEYMKVQSEVVLITQLKNKLEAQRASAKEDHDRRENIKRLQAEEEQLLLLRDSWTKEAQLKQQQNQQQHNSQSSQGDWEMVPR